MKAKPLLPGYHYHIYGRGINDETIFRTREDFVYFLELYKERFHPLVDTFAYCLMRNHYHFQVRVKDVENDDFSPTDPRGTAGEAPQHPAGHPANVAFGRLLMAYAKKFNFKYRRTGGLFESPFGRKHVHSDAYFSRLVVYIHRNPLRRLDSCWIHRIGAGRRITQPSLNMKRWLNEKLSWNGLVGDSNLSWNIKQKSMNMIYPALFNLERIRRVHRRFVG